MTRTQAEQIAARYDASGIALVSDAWDILEESACVACRAHAWDREGNTVDVDSVEAVTLRYWFDDGSTLTIPFKNAGNGMLQIDVARGIACSKAGDFHSVILSPDQESDSGWYWMVNEVGSAVHGPFHSRESAILDAIKELDVDQAIANNGTVTSSGEVLIRLPK